MNLSSINDSLGSFNEIVKKNEDNILEENSFIYFSENEQSIFSNNYKNINGLKNNEKYDSFSYSFVERKMLNSKEDFSSDFQRKQKTTIEIEEDLDAYHIPRNKDIKTQTKNEEPYFLVINKKRGRKRLSEEKKDNIKKEHSNLSLDNLLAKIQVHFLSFIISLSNDALKKEYGKNTKLKFIQLSYNIKKKINYDFFNKFKESSIKDILKMSISEKYKRIDKNNNKIILNKVCEEFNWLKQFFSKTYMDIFEQYYYKFKNKLLDEIDFMENTIILDKNKTLSVYNLLEKNSSSKKNIIDTIELYYLGKGISYLGKNPFSVLKKTKKNQFS